MEISTNKAEDGPLLSAELISSSNAASRQSVGNPSTVVASTVVFIVTLTVYLRTLAPTISWRNGGIDSGELVTAIATLGIPHPTGFPTYVLLGRLFILIPIGEIAYRINLMSAVLGAATASLMTIAGTRLIASANRSSALRDFNRSSQTVAAVAAAGGSMAFAFSPLFWSRATIAKEYTLHLCLLAAGIVCLLEWRESRHVRWLLLFGLFQGVAVGDHLTSLSLIPAAIAFVVAVDRSAVIRWRVALGGAAAMAPGVATYAYLPLRAAQHPFLNWDDPSTAAGFLAHLTGASYIPSLAVGLQPVSMAERVLYAVRIVPQQLGWLGLAAFLVGVWVLGQTDLAVLVLGGTIAGINLVFAAAYPVRDSEVYLLPLYLVLALTIGVGITYVSRQVPVIQGITRPTGVGTRRFERAGYERAIVVTFSLAMIVIACVLTFSAVDVSQDVSASRYAMSTLSTVPRDGVLLTNNDEQTFSLWYVQQVLEERTDVVIADVRLLGYPWYRASLVQRYPDLGITPLSDAGVAQLSAGQLSGRTVVVAPEAR